MRDDKLMLDIEMFFTDLFDEDEEDEEESEIALMDGSSATSLQNGVVHKQALMLEAPGSEMSRMLQSRLGKRGSVNVPRSTLVGKHSRSTAENNTCIEVTNTNVDTTL